MQRAGGELCGILHDGAEDGRVVEGGEAGEDAGGDRTGVGVGGGVWGGGGGGDGGGFVGGLGEVVEELELLLGC